MVGKETSVIVATCRTEQDAALIGQYLADNEIPTHVDGQLTASSVLHVGGEINITTRADFGKLAIELLRQHGSTGNRQTEFPLWIRVSRIVVGIVTIALLCLMVLSWMGWFRK